MRAKFPFSICIILSVIFQTLLLDKKYHVFAFKIRQSPLQDELSKPLLSFRGGAKTEVVKATATEQGEASFATSVFNLANNVAGAGLLTLAAGKAAGGSGWIPSIAICCTLAFMSAQTFILVGKGCELTGERSFKGLWSKAFGDSTAYIVDSMIFISCFLSCTIYVGLVGDIFSELLKGTKFPLSRTSVIVTVVATVLFPLNLIRNLSSLAFTSILGLCAILYTVLFMVFRALDGSYSLEVGKFIVDNAITPPSFKGSTMWNMDLGSLVLVSNFGLAFIAHYNAPSFYKEMKKKEQFPQMTLASYAILSCIYVATMSAGYKTFGDTSRGNILLNYHPKDMLAFLGRLATGFSVIFGFPLVANGCRTGLKNASSALGFPAIADPDNHVPLVIAILTLNSILAILVDDIKIIAGFSGAAMGASLVYICPPLVYTNILKKMFGQESMEYKRGRLSLLFVPFGIFIGVMGVALTYKSMK